MSDQSSAIGIGVIGCGGFGLFALQQFAQVPGVRLVGMAGTHREAARAAARRFGLPDVMEVEALLRMPDLDLVYIATPPFLHHPQAMQALRAGKHVVVEKPTALDPAQADEMIAAARERHLLLATNLMQRYNPLFDTIRELLERKPLGELLHAYFENYASDEGLPPEHWFWDRSKSGGIFVEHGVHFFDLFAGWLGPGKVEAAQVCRRPGTALEDQVQCTVRYGDVLVNFYHGFTQPGRLDRQELRLVFERGDVRLEEWIPVRATIHALVDEADTRTLCELFPGARLDVTAWYAGKERACSGRHKALDVYQLVELKYGQGDLKMHRYSELVRAFLADQLAWLRDRSHVRRVTEQNGRDALAVAVEADRLAHGQRLAEPGA
ncbi:MAG TPA: Gfo/Idh/MocA family oxidoreductase [Gemmataceae bacterium]|nr:Gfo/Idh/MocA family oxidoreductase [Gemmataceae bacterium]